MADKPDDKKQAEDKKAEDKKEPKSAAEMQKERDQKAEDVRLQEKPPAPLSYEQSAGAGANVAAPAPGYPTQPPGAIGQPHHLDLQHLEMVQNERMARVEHAMLMLVEVINELGPWASDIWHSTKVRTKLMQAREHLLPHVKETPDQYSPNRQSAREPIDLPAEFDNRAREPGDTGPHRENFPHPTPLGPRQEAEESE